MTKRTLNWTPKESELLKDNFEEILQTIYSSPLKDYDIWLDFGTLLGYYRENDFISHDLDMDFGIIIPDYQRFVEDEQYLLERGFSRTKEFLLQ